MRRAVAWLSCALAGACAWSNPENRVVWNAFERNVVPEGGVAFWAALPLTLPVGLAAIVADTLVVHPLSVLDDAWRDARSLWEGLDWRGHYYTQLGFLPLRAAATPAVFAGAFLGRACFDVAPHARGDEPSPEAAEAAADAGAMRARCLEFFAALERQEDAALHGHGTIAWDEQLADAFARALRTANARGRLSLYRAGAYFAMPPLVDEPWLGLRDADPVVRYLVLLSWPQDRPLPEGLRADLREDPSEMVRMLARERLASSAPK
ncbi:MAG TPA: hypothetical protein VK081_12945 [Planctomycetota bacterium]|nr:hypothetical protein [Planctomycetota bacterium]